MNKHHFRVKLNFIFLAGLLLLIALPGMLMARQKQGNGNSFRLYTPGISKHPDTIRKLKPGQAKQIIVSRNKNIDHMPIVSPDMKKYNMPVVPPRKHLDDTLIDNRRMKAQRVMPK